MDAGLDARTHSAVADVTIVALQQMSDGQLPCLRDWLAHVQFVRVGLMPTTRKFAQQNRHFRYVSVDCEKCNGLDLLSSWG